eukprot:CAMPEP_0197046196 /NCGR_PEP_ID=MMETSP1384-20130603/21942_1 /TAXON_ID=29189 /ORGANISM="Ammonia sp." /LENGTH=72 /DNA_ID=CAMNT_0042477939 /DNA_START=10 /DNA_END=225 /DNA_ORIENTATION=-
MNIDIHVDIGSNGKNFKQNAPKHVQNDTVNAPKAETNDSNKNSKNSTNEVSMILDFDTPSKSTSLSNETTSS